MNPSTKDTKDTKGTNGKRQEHRFPLCSFVFLRILRGPHFFSSSSSIDRGQSSLSNRESERSASTLPSV